MQRQSRSKRHVQFVENLESRRLLSGAQLSFTDFSSLTGLVANGFGSSSPTSNNALVLTDGNNLEARSVLSSSKVPIGTFTTHFSFVDNAAAQSADGLSFVIDGGQNTDLGANGFDLGYSNGTFGASSVALAFNLYNGNTYGSTFGFTSGGAQASNTTDMTPVDLHSGDTFNATVTYNGSTLSVSVVDASTSATFTDSEAINLPSIVGGNTAFVGFTAGTGNQVSTQQLNSFDFTGSNGPTITRAASSSPTSPTGTKATLHITATSNTGGTLTYAWTLLHKPSGAATPSIKPNNSTLSSAPVAHFFKAGTYIFRCTVTDSNGGSSVSDVAVVVRQTATLIKIAPHKPSIVKAKTEQFHAIVVDQFGHSLSVQPTITYTIATGGGTIGALTGLYTASGALGHLVISAEADELTGIAGAVVVA